MNTKLKADDDDDDDDYCVLEVLQSLIISPVTFYVRVDVFDSFSFNVI